MSLFKPKEAKQRDPFDFAIRIPDGWVAHDPDPDPTIQRQSAEAAVDEMIDAQPLLAEARATLVERMLGFAQDAIEKRAMAAASLWTVIEDTELAANMMVFSNPRDPAQSIESEVGHLKDRLSIADDDDVNKREVTEMDLPAGRAVRLRVMTQTPPGRGETGLVVEMVQYWLPVPDAAHSLIVSCTTPCLVYGDELTGVFDSIAATLELT